MTRFLPKPAPYACAICGDMAPGKWESPTRRSIPPVCRHCEGLWGNQTMADGNTDGRIVNQIKALYSVIEVTAHCQQNRHEAPYGRT